MCINYDHESCYGLVIFYVVHASLLFSFCDVCDVLYVCFQSCLTFASSFENADPSSISLELQSLQVKPDSNAQANKITNNASSSNAQTPAETTWALEPLEKQANITERSSGNSHTKRALNFEEDKKEKMEKTPAQHLSQLKSGLSQVFYMKQFNIKLKAMTTKPLQTLKDREQKRNEDQQRRAN